MRSGRPDMYRRVGDHSILAKLGLARREAFGHLAISVPKPYPDAQLLLEARGMQPRLLETGRFAQMNVYTTDFYGLPDELFWHPEVNWHHQQLGMKGLIAAAGLWTDRTSATISTLQSDLCQQLYRYAGLRNSCKTQVETHFKYWYAVLLNAVLDFCVVSGLSVAYVPVGEDIVRLTKKKIAPDLFLRIYNYPERHLVCRRVARFDAEYWEIPIDANLSRIARLRDAPRIAPGKSERSTLCIFHDIEENVDTDISTDECENNLTQMLAIEREFKLNATYDVLGNLFDRKRPEILASNPRHAIGFHSFNHRIPELTQLGRCRTVDLRVRGYRPPRSQMTPELTDYNLTFSNFEWIASSAFYWRFDDCQIRNGLVKIPIALDDHSIFNGAKAYEEWERELLELARTRRFLAFGLHDCYAGLWLPHYRRLLERLAAICDFVSADDICDGMFLAGESAFDDAARKTPARRGWRGQLIDWIAS